MTTTKGITMRAESPPSADRRFSEFFDFGDVELQMSRHRFVLRGVPGQVDRWERCKAEYRRIKAAHSYDDVSSAGGDPNGR
jgi:hypothetical protein